MLSDKLQGEVSLLDAHSFAWILARIENNELLECDREYLDLSAKQKDAVVKARIGQGYFQDRLIRYWNACSGTGCKEQSLLRASHSKPWAECDCREAIDPFNGLLLSPSLDVAFDAGFIAFDDTGDMLISPSLLESDSKALGISSSLSLNRIDRKHQHYLSYHRKHIFRSS